MQRGNARQCNRDLLSALPVELHQHIISFLEVDSKIMLGMTNNEFKGLCFAGLHSDTRMDYTTKQGGAVLHNLCFSDMVGLLYGVVRQKRFTLDAHHESSSFVLSDQDVSAHLTLHKYVLDGGRRSFSVEVCDGPMSNVLNVTCAGGKAPVVKVELLVNKASAAGECRMPNLLVCLGLGIMLRIYAGSQLLVVDKCVPHWLQRLAYCSSTRHQKLPHALFTGSIIC